MAKLSRIQGAVSRGRQALQDIARLLPLLLLALLAVMGPHITPYDPTHAGSKPSTPPSFAHPMGTDSVGLDVLSQVIAATQLDVWIGLAIAVLASAAGALSGIAIGMTEGRGGISGAISRAAARAIELSSALPVMLVALAVVSFAGAGTTTLIVAIAGALTPNLTRLTRTEVLKVRGDAYVDAARMAGLGEFRIMIRHVFPNSVWPVTESFSFIFGSAIIVTAGLGFLGVGVPVPTPEWGSMIARGVSDIQLGQWWTTFFPSAAMALAVGAVALATRPSRRGENIIRRAWRNVQNRYQREMPMPTSPHIATNAGQLYP